jgi:hypothetical protein
MRIFYDELKSMGEAIYHTNSQRNCLTACKSRIMTLMKNTGSQITDQDVNVLGINHLYYEYNENEILNCLD